MESQLLYNAQALLGEGPVWHHQYRKLYWVDIEGYALHIHDPVNNKNSKVAFDAMPGAVVPMKDGNLLIAFENGLASFNPDTEDLIYKQVLEQNLPSNRCNDGKCDLNGNFWIGTMDKQLKGTGSLYRVTGDFEFSPQILNTSISNGMAWSADHKTMYFIDTATLVVTAYDFNPVTSEIDNPRTIIEVPESYGSPDGMTIDQDGMLWIAHWNGFCVRRWNPFTGDVLMEISVPVPHVTSCTFGGEQLDTLYITTARSGLTPQQLSKYPLSGALFSAKTGFAGKTAYFFKQIK